jgi:protein-disulfide isomerase
MANSTKARAAARAAQQRLAARQRQARRRRAGWVSAVAAAVLLIAGLAGAGIWQATRPSDVAVPTAATDDGAGLAVGTGPVTVEIYLDFLCPACRQFETAARSMLDGYVSDGTATVVYRPIAILDGRTTTQFSTRAAAAAGCAADAGAVAGFVPAMMDNQPAEDSIGLSDDQIIQIGSSAGATGPEFDQCVREGDYRDWVDRNTDEAFDRGVQGTPTVYVDGNRLDGFGLADLAAAIDGAAAAG